MFRLSQKADYGLILLSSVAKAMEDKSNHFISVSSVASKHKISSKFLSRVAQELKRAGILSAKEGVSGGYILSKNPKDIKILDILQILEGDLIEGKCFDENHECKCGARDIFIDFKKQMQATFGKKTVADLLLR